MVLAAMAFIGTTSAFAVDQEVTLCTLNVLLCPSEGEIYNTGQSFLLAGGPSKFSGGIKEECKESDMSGKTLANMGAPLLVDLTGFVFKECKPCEPITVTATGDGQITMNASGTFALKVPINIIYTGCIEGTKCTFSSTAVTIGLENTKGAPAVTITEQKFALTEGSKLLCGESMTWSSVLSMSEPSPVFLSLYELIE
jgi:hypothetical protein